MSPRGIFNKTRPSLWTTIRATTHISVYRRAAFYNTLMSKTGLTVTRAAALRTNINIDGRPLPTKKRWGNFQQRLRPSSPSRLCPPVTQFHLLFTHPVSHSVCVAWRYFNTNPRDCARYQVPWLSQPCATLETSSPSSLSSAVASPGPDMLFCTDKSILRFSLWALVFRHDSNAHHYHLISELYSSRRHPHRRPTRASVNESGRSRRSSLGVTLKLRSLRVHRPRLCRFAVL